MTIPRAGWPGTSEAKAVDNDDTQIAGRKPCTRFRYFRPRQGDTPDPKNASTRKL